MKIEKLDIVRFAPKGKDSFYDAVIAKVKDNFETNQISPYATTDMWLKTIIMLLLYFVPYTLITSGLTLFWMTAKDYLQVVRYKQHDLLIKHKVSLSEAVLRTALYKLFYYTYIILLPILFLAIPWYLVVTGFLLMHFTAGLFLSCVFQPSHIMEVSPYSLPVGLAGKRRMEDSWAVH